ncbi:MAG: LPS export ABC transporter permease LptG [Proteobacteria bacterium]|nr:LPS export ABC transporter permease LptG [Pseudomonadota bacterium]
MKILQRYILKNLLRNLAISITALTSLFLLFDLFDRLDNLVEARASIGTIVTYFALKVPLTLTLMMPISMLIATLFTFGLLSRSSEITAIRAAGIPISWFSRPLIVTGLVVSLSVILINETIAPYATRRSKELYNIDIRKKDKLGSYSQSNFWWREGQRFYSVDTFDSRDNSLENLSYFDLSTGFDVVRRTDAERTTFVDPLTGWNMQSVTEQRFSRRDATEQIESRRFNTLPLPISQTPQEFYDVRADRSAMSFRELRRFIKKQAASGIVVKNYYPDLYEKISFPFVSLLCTLVALPFALKPARTGSMAVSMISGLIIGFTYYAVHYFSLALGRAELWPALLSAWMANILMGFVAIVLNLGAESPQ